MVTRCMPLFMAAPEALHVVAAIGGFTALLAGSIAVTQTDLKRVLAYSTVSQLGYMFLSLGTGSALGIIAGMFHLFTHAFFKALLFLGAGSVMHAMGGIIDMRRFGGLRRLMPYTYWTFLIGCLALSGVFPFAGFWSKDSIIGSVHDKVHSIEHELEHRHEPLLAAALTDHAGHSAEQQHVASPLAQWSDNQLNNYATAYTWLYWSAVFAAFLTALYTFRAFFLTFHGEEHIPHEAGHHAHESPSLMTVPLVVLAVCASVIGILIAAFGIPTGNWGANWLADFIGRAPSLAAGTIAATKTAPEFHLSVAGLSTVVALAGILLAMYLYMGEQSEARALKRFFDWEGLSRLTDPQWVVNLQRVRCIGATTRYLRKLQLGWLVTAVGYLLGLVSLILAAPLLIGNFVTPYRLSLHKFYFDEIYDVLVVWPLRILSAILYWIDRWIVDGLVSFAGRIAPAGGYLMRSLQMGQVQFYALAMVLGTLILVAARMLWAAG